MTRAFDPPKTAGRGLRSVAGWFRLVALLEAMSWVGLLTGMYFKYLGNPRTEVGVQIFGAIHGAMFVGFLAAAALAAFTYKWSLGTVFLALLASILPLATVIFLIWADRTAKLDREARPADANGGLSAGTGNGVTNLRA